MRLEKVVTQSGDGRTFPNAGDKVTVEYSGWLHNFRRPNGRGTVFDSSSLRGPFTTLIGVDKVIKGWDILVCQMSLGEKSILSIPAALAYGSWGFPGCIPPDADLIFEVELLSIQLS